MDLGFGIRFHDLYEREGLARQGEVDVGESADEGEQDAEADAERRDQPRIAQVFGPGGERRRRRGLHLLHWSGTCDREIDQQGARKVERGEEVEIPGQTEMVNECSRDEAADQIGRDIAGDVGSKGPSGVRRAALLAKICEGEREGRGHAQPLRDTQDRKGGQVRSDCQQCGWDR